MICYMSLTLAFYIHVCDPGIRWFDTFCLFKSGIFLCGVEGTRLVETPLGATAPIWNEKRVALTEIGL